MQKLKEEYAATVLEMLREGKTEKEIALATQKHRTTVSRYVNHLRSEYHIDFKLLQNELLSELQERIKDMSDRDLIHFLSCLLPQKIESTTEQIGTQRVLHLHMWRPNDDPADHIS
jgi:hypothetical protein